ncbi:MAG: AmmeMemoRadiSam system protein B [Phycisphaerales bacterium]
MTDSPEAASSPTPPQPPPPPFDASRPHHAQPRLRPVRGFPAQAKTPDGQTHTMLGLADARQISDKMVLTMPAAQFILPLMDGTRGVDTLVTEVGRGLTRPFLEQLIAQLDDAGLLEGPAFEAMLRKMREDFDSLPVLPPASSAQFAESLVERDEQGAPKESDLTSEQQAERLGKVFDAWIAEALKQATDPSWDDLPRAIVAPHLDYPRGWVNYASVYGRLRVADRPDRVVILGTNHFGLGTGVTACDKGYQTCMGVCELDADAAAILRQRLGEAVFAHRYDHEREHSIELQVPWIQHTFGKDDQGRYPRVLGVLVHDPSVKNGASYDGQGVDLQPFVDALKEITRLPGRTLIVSSADLSHCGPAFGDEHPLAGEGPEHDERRNRIFNHDREMLGLVGQNKPWDLVAAMSWQSNPTRWCSTGNIVAALLAVEPSEVRLLNYAAAMDQQGTTLVSSFAAAMI